MDGKQFDPDLTAAMREDNLAWRIKYEMERRGWSQERLAQEMAKVGHPIHQSAVSKIVNERDGVKRRAISVDEAIGFARVFQTPVEDLFAPMEVAKVRVFQTLVRRIWDASGRATVALDDLDNLWKSAQDLLQQEEVIQVAAHIIESNEKRRVAEDRERFTAEQAALWLERNVRKSFAVMEIATLRARARELRRDWASYRDEEYAYLRELSRHLSAASKGELDLAAVRTWRDENICRLRTAWTGETFDQFLELMERGEDTTEAIETLREWVSARREAIRHDQQGVIARSVGRL